MVLDAPGQPLRPAEVCRSCSRPGSGPGAGQGLRGLPHRPACRRRRASRPQAAADPGPRDRGRGAGLRPRPGRRSRSAGGWASPGSAIPAGPAPTAAAAARTCATRRASPATPWTAATPSSPSRTPPTAFPCPTATATLEAAPLLCAGLIGWRTLRMAGDARRLGIWGFGAAAHIVAQVARHEGREFYAFTRPGDTAAQDLRARAWVPSGLATRMRSRRPSSTPP